MYCVTKAAIAHLAKCLAVEWGKYNITVNAVAPTFIHSGSNLWHKQSENARPRVGLAHLVAVRRVKFTYQELPNDEAFITAQIERNRVVYSILLAQTEKPLSRAEVESYFEDELSMK